MRTFTGKYKNGSYVFSYDNDTLRAQLLSILNTPIGSRFYAPSYGSRLNSFRFSILNYFTIQMIGQEIKDAISLMSGVSLKSINYIVEDNVLNFTIELNRMSEIVRINLTVVDGVVS